LVLSKCEFNELRETENVFLSSKRLKGECVMKKKMSVISFTLFLIATASYLAVLTGIDEFLLAAVICSVAGLVLALFADSGKYKKISIFGNGVIIFISVFIPFVVTTFFWNTP
jgi:hypothetical protein